MSQPPTDPVPVPTGWEGILTPGERILWQGQPDGAVVWRDLFKVDALAGLIFSGGALALIFKASKGSPVIIAVGLIFFAFGLYLLIGRLFMDAYRRRSTHYTLTNKTAFIATALRGRRKLERYPLGPKMRITLEDDPPGSVWFAMSEEKIPGRWQGSHSDGMYVPGSTVRRRIGFRRIDDARHVYGLMIETIGAVPQGGSNNKKPLGQA